MAARAASSVSENAPYSTPKPICRAGVVLLNNGSSAVKEPVLKGSNSEIVSPY